MSSAFVVGYTGETGKLLLKELIVRKRFHRLVLIGRKPATPDLPNGVEVKVVDFDKLDEYKSDFVGFDQGFCCLGSSRAKHGTGMFLKVDRDYTNKVTELAKAGGCKHYHLVSSAGAGGFKHFQPVSTSGNETSWNLYLDTKFLAEETAVNAGFNRVSIYQPGLLLGDRAESRPGERFMKFLAEPIAWAFPTTFTTPTEIVAKAMVSRSMIDKDENPPKEISRLSIADIFNWAKKLEQ